MNLFIRRSLVICAAFLSTSCTQRLVDFTIISTKNVDLSRAGSFIRTARRATGEDAKQIIIVFPTGVPSAKEAVDRAIESVPGGIALVDGVLTHSFFYIPYIVGENKYIVEGTVLIDPALAKITATTASNNRVDTTKNHHIIYCNKAGQVTQKESVSKQDYLKFKKKHGLLAARQ
jgi:hypothetical protein